MILGSNTQKFSWNLFLKNNVFIIYVLSALKVCPEKKIDCPTLHYIFAARYISCKKTYAIRNQKNLSITPGSWGGDHCNSQTPRLLLIAFSQQSLVTTKSTFIKIFASFWLFVFRRQKYLSILLNRKYLNISKYLRMWLDPASLWKIHSPSISSLFRLNFSSRNVL